MKTLAVIPARAGSKGVSGKNRRLFMGKPLVAWAIEVAKRTCTKTCVTSDDPLVLQIAEEYGVEAIDRPKVLAEDVTPMVDVLKHVLSVVDYSMDAVVLLQPTQPLRTDAQVKDAIWSLYLGTDLDSIVSLVEIPAHCSPDFAVLRDPVTNLLTFPPATRRQDCQTAYYRDGTVYVIRPAIIRRGELYGSSAPLLIGSEQSCNIDSEEDWTRAERMWRERGNE